MDDNDPTKTAPETHGLEQILDVDLGTSPPFEATGPNITDSDGNEIDSDSDYKLMMSDGTELGMVFTHLDWLADESPSNGGAIIEFSLTPPYGGPQKWSNNGFAFVRGASYENGTLVKRYLYVFQVPGPPVIYPIGWTNNPAKATKFRAFQMPGNRVSLRAFWQNDILLGIRLNKQKNLLEGDRSELRLPLAGQFVKVQTLPMRIT